MIPTFEKGDLILVKKQKEYNVGDINGYITKGDANNTKDEETIYENVIRGKLFLLIKVPFK